MSFLLGVTRLYRCDYWYLRRSFVHCASLISISISIVVAVLFASFVFHRFCSLTSSKYDASKQKHNKISREKNQQQHAELVHWMQMAIVWFNQSEHKRNPGENRISKMYLLRFGISQSKRMTFVGHWHFLCSKRIGNVQAEVARWSTNNKNKNKLCRSVLIFEWAYKYKYE